MSQAILITGGSRGIGAALAQECARRGYRLALTARQLPGLEPVVDAIRREVPQARVECRALDVTDATRTVAVVQELDAAMGGLDIVVANAGIGIGAPIGSGHLEKDIAVIQTNVIGAMATIDAAVALFKARSRGQVVAISSVAAARGLPASGAYCASKAAIATYADAARIELHGTPIKVTTLFPGFIDTEINRHLKQRPFLIDAAHGARIMADMIERGVESSAVPRWPWNAIMSAMRRLPASVLAKQVKMG